MKRTPENRRKAGAPEPVPNSEATRWKPGPKCPTCSVIPKDEASGMNKNKVLAPSKTKSQLAAEEKFYSMIPTIPDATGIRDHTIADRIVCQVAESLLVAAPAVTPETVKSRLIQAIGTLSEVGPQNGSEAMLSAQMIAAHEAAIHFTKLGAAQTRLEAVEVCARQATRFMRVFNEQLEAMQKLKGKTGQQKVTVEHVHVNEGGQAIVGALVAQPGGRDEQQNR